MEDDEDTVMGDSHTLPTLGSNQPRTQTLPTHLGSHPTPTLTPSLNTKPGTSPSPVSDQSQSRGSGMGPPDRLAKTSDTGSSSADQFSRVDSLVEPNSDWEEEEEKKDMAKPGLPIASLATGLCYDHRMRYHCEVKPESDLHPEDPRRIYYIYKELCRAGLVDDEESARPLAPKTLERIGVRDATEEEITMIHTDAHYAFVRSTREMHNDDLILLEMSRDSIYFNKLTFASSLLSAGGAIETCMAVAERRVKNAIAVIRPPGHHAEPDKAMGFCLFNNVSVAARVCQQKLGDACRKIMILDWDVHHGNGIQEAFYDDPNVLYISLHVFQGGNFYPNGPAGDWDKCGEGLGIGRNVNIPWPSQGMGDGDYMYAFQEVVMPIAQEFDPDLVINILRIFQSNQLFESCKLTPLYVYRTGISQSFEKQVLASPNYTKAVPLVVIFHDPPEIMGQAHPVTNKMEAHNVWMADSLKGYIKWICDKGYGVIDVNIPKHITREESFGRYEGEDDDRPTATEELAAYLWDNYIDANQATEIFFLGVGNSFHGVVNLLINRGAYRPR
ncbi:unnamed protein product [Penicillium olsonii]|uniref:histone deacetylase n=1 Tax=Penicillium olsonii TaxID=99116 RepID=A0A9W4ICJ2_PENOL|nr:unnamed protein product [Penicillium olsonii]CAG7927588.1 unnamed protein product [Penicillium olsonii]CAG8109832.1 unnamed protein product [Penicillium olsonii]CAG8247856.1 unnamed protein product [Penicillium olsonii]CAG8261068.1 unnamed protein product [Penicillium olsonii]